MLEGRLYNTRGFYYSIFYSGLFLHEFRWRDDENLWMVIMKFITLYFEKYVFEEKGGEVLVFKELDADLKSKFRRWKDTELRELDNHGTHSNLEFLLDL